MGKSYNQGVADANRRRAKHNQATRDHGTTKEYKTWIGIKQRCTNPNSSVWERYGGRGITICEEWLHDFDAFYKHIGKAPTLKHTVDRIDNNRGYEPGNVRWATRKEQSNNLRSNTWIEYDGKRMTWAQWAEYLDVPYNLLLTRVKKKLPLEEVLQPRINDERNALVEVDGKAMSLREWEKVTGIKYQTLYARWKAGKYLLAPVKKSSCLT